MLHRAFIVAACVAVFCAAVLLARTKQSEIAILNQLAPKIERAQELSPASKETIERLLAKAQSRLDDPRPGGAENFRQRAIIERVAEAIKPKTDAPPANGIELSGSAEHRKGDADLEFSTNR